MRLRNSTLLLILLVTTSCGAGFDTGIRRGLTASQITYNMATDAFEEFEFAAEKAGIAIPKKTFKAVVVYESRHRTVHNMIVSLSKQYVNMRNAGVGGDELKTLEAQILSFQANLALILAELVVFLQELGAME